MTLAAAVIWASPILLTLGVAGFLALSLRGRRSYGSRSSSFVSMGLVWLFHAGYLLGPWLISSGRSGLALWLMIPAGVLFFVGGVVVAVATGIVGDCLHHPLPATAAFVLFLLALVAYVGPVVVLVAARA